MATILKEKDQCTLSTIGGFALINTTEIASMMAEELDGLDVDFERIKIPSGGSTMFELPGEDSDEGEMVKEFSGVILHHHTVYAYYKDKYTGGNNPPDCSSFDGQRGTGDPGMECCECPFGRFGSGENGGKACKHRRRIFILREGEMFPLLLSLPTGSLKEFSRYIKKLLSKGKKTSQVVTRFSLKKAKNSKGIEYSQGQFAIDRTLTQEEYGNIAKWAEQIKEISKKIAADYDLQDSTGNGVLIEVDEETGEVISPLTGDGSPPISNSDVPF